MINDLQIGLLGFILDNPLHGYAIHKKLQELSGIGIVWKLKPGRLYQILEKMNNAGLINDRNIFQGNRPKKIEYQITSKGREVFESWVNTPVLKGRDFRIMFLMKLYWQISSENPAWNELIERQLLECEKWKNSFSTISEKASDSFEIVVNKFRETQIDRYINWLKWCQNFLGSIKK
jgi:DNA-binding PadR family transcriptional regulator